MARKQDDALLSIRFRRGLQHSRTTRQRCAAFSFPPCGFTDAQKAGSKCLESGTVVAVFIVPLLLREVGEAFLVGAAPSLGFMVGLYRTARLGQMIPVEVQRRLLLILHLLQVVDLTRAQQRRLHLKSPLEFGVIYVEGTFFQGHAGLKTMAPEDFVLDVRCPGLTRHS